MIIWSNILIPVASMMITVFATIYTVSKRVKNENRKKHKPYLTLNTIETLKEIDEYKYYLTITHSQKNSINPFLPDNPLKKRRRALSISVRFSRTC